MFYRRVHVSLVGLNLLFATNRPIIARSTVPMRARRIFLFTTFSLPSLSFYGKGALVKVLFKNPIYRGSV